jgi:SAM-dependent methyltransferase
MSVLFAALAVLMLLDALRLRGRAKALATIPPASAASEASDADDADYEALVSPAVRLEPAVRGAAAAYARREGLAALDLVPTGLFALDALGFLQTLDVARYRQNRLAPGRTAAHATLARRDLLERARLEGAAVRDPASHVRATARLKRHACTSTDVAVAPGLAAVPFSPRERKAALRASAGDVTALALGVQIAVFSLISAGPFLSPIAGAAALAAFHAQVAIALAGTPLTPRGLLVATLLRAPLELVRWVRLVASREPPDATAAMVAARRPIYAELLAAPLDRFFEPRRTTCPLCESADLSLAIRTTDLFQQKPGEFRLDRCGACGHVFQNPRLSVEGLSFYYRDFYDGLGEERLELLFGIAPDAYLSRARTLRGHALPERWLDVGAGHGHFCCVAREEWPSVVFDGLDQSESLDEAVRRGWMDHGHRGFFPDVAPSLAGRYDVVSMSHYLEHTRDPRAELAAAALALRAGGHLLIEVPDPESKLGRVFGRLWMPWLQPQHQHLVPLGSLRRLLDEAGFTEVLCLRGEVHIAAEALFATTSLIDLIARPLDLPWHPPPSLAARAWRFGVWAVALPLVVVARLVDVATRRLFARPGWSNAYRVLAKKRA